MKPEIKYGLMAAVLLILWTLIQFALGFHTVYFGSNKYTFWGIAIILFFTILPALREKRMDFSGHLSLRQGMRTGVIQLFITTSIALVFMFFYDYRINPLWVENLVAWQHNNDINDIFSHIANDVSVSPDTVILSNTELHLCYYSLGILFFGGFLTFIITASLGNKKVPNAESPKDSVSATLKHQNF